jgi:hypothetical protein
MDRAAAVIDGSAHDGSVHDSGTLLCESFLAPSEPGRNTTWLVSASA